MNIIAVDNDTLNTGTGGNDLAYATIDSGNAFFGEDGDDILLGNGAMHMLYGGNGNDTLMGSFGRLNLGSYAVDGVFDHLSAFVDDEIGSYLDGGDGDDLIYVGRFDMAVGGNGNDVFDLRFAARKSAWIVGGNGVDRVIFNLQVGDNYVRDDYGNQEFRFNGPALVDASSIEEMEVANAGNRWGTGNFVHTFGFGSQIFSFDRRVTAALGAGSGDILLDPTVLAEFSEPGGSGFDLVSDAAELMFDFYRVFQGNQMTTLSGPSTYATRFGTLALSGGLHDAGVTMSYTPGATALADAIAAGVHLRLGLEVFDTSLRITGDYSAVSHGVLWSDVSTRVELYFTLPDNLDLSGVAGLTRGVLLTTVAAGSAITATEFDDTLQGLAGNDSLYGGKGADSLMGGNGHDRVDGGGGRDILFGGNGNDTVHGGAGADTLYGRADDDVLYGGGGNDRLFGEKGNDVLYAGAGNDWLVGGDGNDVLHGVSGNNTLNGGNGDDILLAGTGNDVLRGGAGADLFIFALPGSTHSSAHTIADFDITADTLRIGTAWNPMATPTWQQLIDTAVDGPQGVILTAFDTTILLASLTLNDLSAAPTWYDGPVI